MNVELRVEDLLGDWSDLVNFDYSLGETGLLLPLIESIASPSSNHMAEHGFLFLISIPITMDLSSEMSIVLV